METDETVATWLFTHKSPKSGVLRNVSNKGMNGLGRLFDFKGRTDAHLFTLVHSLIAAAFGSPPLHVYPIFTPAITIQTLSDFPTLFASLDPQVHCG